jgi:beta-lactamase regulating signal transducer with metallopeptidase domain
MIAMLTFSAVAALLVHLAGWRDRARDPRLTVITLVLLAVFPLLIALVPKCGVLPATASGGGVGGFPWMKVLLLLWSAGFLIATARLLFAAKGVSNWRKHSVLVCRSGSVEIRRLDDLRGPVAAGVFRPVIFVPQAWDEWSEGVRGLVLDHELAHHRRRDPLWRWVAEIACAVNGLNPFVIWITRRLTLQCEYACDALVLKKGVPAGDYARLLCDFAEDRPSGRLVLAMSASTSLESRVRRLMRPDAPQGRVGIVLLATLAVVMAAVLASIAPVDVSGPPVFAEEVKLRWSADPFPGEN